MSSNDHSLPARQFCEALEARIAPATLVNASTLSFQDVDGDAVTVSFSKKVLTSQEAVDAAFDFAAGPETGEFLQTLDLSALGLTAAKLRGLNISITAEAANGGDGQVDIGFLNAAGIDLGKVTVDGALAKIVAGDAKVGTAGLKALIVESLGLPDGSEPADLYAISSVITGALPKLHVAGDIAKASLFVEGGSKTGINQLFVGGSLVGGDNANSGSIQVSGGIAKAVITDNLEGGSGKLSGALIAAKAIKSVFVGDSLMGGTGADSGHISSGASINKLTVQGSLVGHTGAGSGSVEAALRVLRADIDGDLDGSSGIQSGSVLSLGGKLGRIDHEGAAHPGAGEDSGRFLGSAVEKSRPAGGTLTVGGGSYSSAGVSSNISGALVKLGSGNLTLSGPPTYTGGTGFTAWGSATISGSFSFPANTQLGAGASLVVLETASVLLPNGSYLPPGTYTSETLAPYLIA